MVEINKEYIYKKASNSTALNPPFIVNGIHTTNNTEKANALNEFFTASSTLELTGLERTPDESLFISTLDIIRVPAQTVKEIFDFQQNTDNQNGSESSER